VTGVFVVLMLAAIAAWSIYLNERN